MVVSAHGKVDEYCAAHGMVIAERYNGDLAEYRGGHSVLVTDNCSDKHEYYYLKYLLLKRKVQLISTHWESREIEDFVAYLHQQEKERQRSLHEGRPAFGFRKVGGVTVEDERSIGVARRIIELRDLGWTYRQIIEEDDVRYPDGRKMSPSTIQVILRNRSKYE